MLIFGNSFPKSSNGISEEQSALNINIQLRKVSKIFLVFVWYVIFGRSRFPLRLRWEACMGPMGPGLLGGIEPCSFSSLLELVSELLLSTAGVWSAAPCPAQPSLQAPSSFISYLCASEWRMYCPCSLFISIIFMPF